jgi:hypothetical protein
MRVRLLSCAVAVSLGALTSGALADSLHRCADGTFTNKSQRQCAPYESKGIVRVQGEAAKSDTKQSVAEVKLLEGKDRTRGGAR